MISNQERVLTFIEQQIVKAGFVPTMSSAFANGGTIGIQNDDFPINLAEVSFGFQPGTMEFELRFTDGTDLKTIPYPGRTDGYCKFYMRPSEAERFTLFIVSLNANLKILKAKFGKKKTRPVASTK
jgi:hypothetical protein